MTEDWIKEAWNEANSDNEKFKKEADYLYEQLDEKLVTLTDIWIEDHEDLDACMVIVRMCAENRAISDALFALNRIFFIGGFTAHKQYTETQ